MTDAQAGTPSIEEMRNVVKLPEDAMTHIANLEAAYASLELTVAALRKEVAELTNERDAYAKESDLRLHMILTCGVAADHPDANLSRTGAYAGKWNSKQAEYVRTLRDRAEQSSSRLSEAERLIAHAVQIMTPEQVGQWTGVRAWLRRGGMSRPQRGAVSDSRSDELKWLEKIWIAAVAGRLPFQSKAAIYKRMEAQGLVQWGEESLGNDRFGSIKVSGWYLTHAGRHYYCASCTDSSWEAAERG